jgi:hypothetical protein
VHVFAAAAETASDGAGAYLVVFALMALSFGGLVIAAGCITLAVRYYRRRKARRLLGNATSPQ